MLPIYYTGQPISKRLQFCLGRVKLGVDGSRSKVEVLDDDSAQLTVYNVSREMSGTRLTCHVTGHDVDDRMVSAHVNVRVAGISCVSLA